MVDIHSHVLPGLDDGARTMDESLEMLRLAAASGTICLVLKSFYVFDVLGSSIVRSSLSQAKLHLLT